MIGREMSRIETPSLGFSKVSSTKKEFGATEVNCVEETRFKLLTLWANHKLGKAKRGRGIPLALCRGVGVRISPKSHAKESWN